MFQICGNEYQHILEERKERLTDSDENSALLKIHNNLKLFKEHCVYKPIFLLTGLFFFQQLSLGYAIIFYAVDIFKQIGGDIQKSLNAYVALVFLGAIRFIMSLLSVISSRRVGRRPTMLYSVTGMFISIFVAGYLYSHETNSSNNTTSYLLLVYICFSSIGYFVIPWTLIGEILPIKVRGKLGGVMISVAYIFMFVAVKTFPFLLYSCSIKHIFYGLSIINLSSLVFIYYMLPETLGKTFIEIEEYFNTKRRIR